MDNFIEETMTATEHLKVYGIQYASEFIFNAEHSISEIITMENESLTKDPHDTTDRLNIALALFSKRYFAYHCIGMAFELLYKTTIILLENEMYEWTHKISTLHNQLDISKEKISKIITNHGWTTVTDFTSYLDQYFTNPHNKYFENYLVFGKEEYKHPTELINLWTKIMCFVVENANRNNSQRPRRWSYPQRLLSRP